MDNWALIGSTIYGVNIGFEYLPNENSSQFDEDAKWGMLFDLFFVRLVFLKF